jgi:uncharacterized membrane protein YbaN (DUF454 family)
VKWILFSLAWISFALGIIGAFLPILPTTPFLILSAYLFSKSSPRFYQWLLNLPYAGAIILDWNQNRIISKKAKLLCSSMLIVSLIVIWKATRPILIVKILLTLLLISVGGFVNAQKSSLRE